MDQVAIEAENERLRMSWNGYSESQLETYLGVLEQDQRIHIRV